MAEVGVIDYFLIACDRGDLARPFENSELEEIILNLQAANEQALDIAKNLLAEKKQALDIVKTLLAKRKRELLGN